MIHRMVTANTRTFYKDMKPVPSGEGMCDIAQHRQIPPDWCVVVVDIVGSTKAIERGQYKDVNTIAASSITAVLNAAGRSEIAYIFGGDGATLLVPAALVFDVAAALYGTRQLSKDGFNLDMRAGIVFAEELQKMNAPVRVAKTEVSPGVYQSAMSGEGISLAEKLVKGETGQQYDITSLFAEKVLASKPVDFTGLECRWQPLETRNGVDLSVIVLARQGTDTQKATLYGEMLSKIESLCGKAEGWKPVSASQLNVTSNPQKLSGEATVRTAGKGAAAHAKYLAHLFCLTLVGKACFAFGLKVGDFDGSTYKAATITNNDYIKFDNTLRLIMDVTKDQQAALSSYLEGLVREGKVFYGIHAAPSALMTCIVFDYASQHFHFVDGADGGYALAAKQLKQQVKDAAQVKAA